MSLDPEPELDFSFLAKPFREQLKDYPMREKDKEQVDALSWALRSANNLYANKILILAELKRVRIRVELKLRTIIRKLVRMDEYKKKKKGGE